MTSGGTMNPIVRGFKKLADFKGRDRRSQFWPYAGVAYGVFYVVQSVATQFALMPIQIAFHRNAEKLMFVEAEVSDAAGTLVVRSGHSPLALFEGIDFTPLIIIMALGSLAYVLLLAAAVSRRLHDRGLSAWWAGGYYLLSHIPTALMVVGMSKLGPVIEGAEAWNPQTMGPAMMWMISGVSLGSLLSIGGLILLIQLCLKGKAGPNRYGPEPA